MPPPDPASHDLWSNTHTPTCGHKHRQIPVPASFTTLPTLSNLNELLPTLQRDGFVIVRSVLPPHLLLAAQAASKYLVGKAREGTFWPYVRTVGKQYPPWPEIDVVANKEALRAHDQAKRQRQRERNSGMRNDHSTTTNKNSTSLDSTNANSTTTDSATSATSAAAAAASTTTAIDDDEANLPPPPSIPNIWGIQHLLHPSLEYLRTVYAELYFSDPLITIIRHLLADPTTLLPAPASTLVFELLNLLISPSRSQNFELEWHRDDIRSSLSADEERKLLGPQVSGARLSHAQYNLALFADESLLVVPGSHRRARTETERNAGRYDVLPGQVTVVLGPGDAVFYDSNILHRGVYGGIEVGEELGRMTVHGSVGVVGAEERARVVLQHGVAEWVGEAVEGGFGIEDVERRERASGMVARLLEMAEGKEELGFSLEG